MYNGGDQKVNYCYQDGTSYMINSNKFLFLKLVLRFTNNK